MTWDSTADEEYCDAYFDPAGEYEPNTTIYTITILTKSSTSKHPKHTVLKIKAKHFPLECRCEHLGAENKYCTSASCYRINDLDWPPRLGKNTLGGFKCYNPHCKGHRWPTALCFGKQGIVKVDERSERDWSGRWDWEKVFREWKVPDDVEINKSHWKLEKKGFFSRFG